MSKLEFAHSKDGRWKAGGWVIGVDRDGLFWIVYGPHADVPVPPDRWRSLADAIEWCERLEKRMAEKLEWRIDGTCRWVSGDWTIVCMSDDGRFYAYVGPLYQNGRSFSSLVEAKRWCEELAAKPKSASLYDEWRADIAELKKRVTHKPTSDQSPDHGIYEQLREIRRDQHDLKATYAAMSGNVSGLSRSLGHIDVLERRIDDLAVALADFSHHVGPSSPPAEPAPPA